MENTDDAVAFGRTQAVSATVNIDTAAQKVGAWVNALLMTTLALLIITGVLYNIRTNPLIDTVSVSWYVVICGCGIVFGLLNVIFSPDSSAVKLTEETMTMVPILWGFVFALNANAALEIYAFSSFTPQKSQVLAPITGVSGCGGGHGDGITVRPYPSSRDVRIRTTISICERFEPWKRDGHDCVLLDIDTGRNGIRRVSAPLYVRRC